MPANVVKYDLSEGNACWLTILRSRKARRVSIVVRPPDRVRLTVPVGLSVDKGMAFLDSRREWIESSLERLKAKVADSEAVVPTPLSDEERDQLRTMAAATLPTMCVELANEHKFEIGNIRISSARTRWGSCSSDNNLSFSCYLVHLPHDLIRYVILHELCHTVHKDHSKNFYALLDKVTDGRSDELNARLKKFRPC